MRTIALLLLATLVPTATATPPTFEYTEGEATVRAFLANSTTICQDSGDALLVIEREMEAATFHLTVQGACVPTLTFRGTLTHNGWTFHDAAGLQSGAFTTEDGGGTWRLHATVDACPPHVICEFTHGVRVSGAFPHPFAVW